MGHIAAQWVKWESLLSTFMSIIETDYLFSLFKVTFDPTTFGSLGNNDNDLVISKDNYVINISSIS